MATNAFSIFRTAGIIVAALIITAGCAQNRTPGGIVDDATADATVKTQLLRDGLYDYSDVDLTLFEGRLMLTGTMRTQEGKEHVAALGRRANQVTQVINEIVLAEKTGYRQGAKDALIDRQLATALLTDTGVIRQNYQFAVSNGVVYLIGVAQGPTELTRATEQARRIDGVKRVVSHVIYVGDPSRATRFQTQ